MTEIPALDLVADRKVVKKPPGGNPPIPTPWGRGPLGEMNVYRDSWGRRETAKRHHPGDPCPHSKKLGSEA